MALFRKHPSYEERLLTGDERPRLSVIGHVKKFALFLMYNCIALACSLYMRVRYRALYADVDENFFRYEKAFGFFSVTGNLHKVQESLFYRKVAIEQPSLEIGICRGDISALHFEGQHFSVGSEFLDFTAEQAARDFDLWDEVVSESMTAMVHKSSAFGTVCVVHTIDHIEEVDDALAELNRVMKKGGRAYLSGYTNNVFRADPVAIVIGLFSRKARADYERTFARNRHYCNLFSESEWRQVLARNGFEMTEFAIFEGGPCRSARHFLHHYLSSGGCFSFGWIGYLAKMRWVEKLFLFYYRSIGIPVYNMLRRGQMAWGSDFFLEARKTEKAGRQVSRSQEAPRARVRIKVAGGSKPARGAKKGPRRRA